MPASHLVSIFFIIIVSVASTDGVAFMVNTTILQYATFCHSTALDIQHIIHIIVHFLCIVNWKIVDQLLCTMLHLTVV